ncbi:MAG: YggS family pyridoxal phosphate-dependent enzyme [Anaerolineae bacterium]|nr:YggS family pyridoxal phosphate-dependent enzyme [Anaerolineae bacterium]
MEYAELVRRNLRTVRERIAEAALRSGRSPDEVTLVAVTKTFPVQAILVGYAAGLRHFGENRPEEGAEKIPQVNAAMKGELPAWHMVGHVQSRKAELVVAHFDRVHSIDRLKIARRLNRLAGEAGKEMPVLLECNVSGEASKYGFPADRWQGDAGQREALFAACADVLALPALRVEGLMTVAPIAADPDDVRPVFAALRALRDALRERFPRALGEQLSMGMSDDFEAAVEEGATMVRIGRSIFGPRPN